MEKREILITMSYFSYLISGLVTAIVVLCLNQIIEVWRRSFRCKNLLGSVILELNINYLNLTKSSDVSFSLKTNAWEKSFIELSQFLPHDLFKQVSEIYCGIGILELNKPDIVYKKVIILGIKDCLDLLKRFAKYKHKIVELDVQ